jgi:hypothetical protein
MARQVIRDIRSVTVGTASTLLLPERTARLLTVVGAPPPPAIPAVPSLTMTTGAAISTTGQKIGYVVPAGSTARAIGWSWASVSVTAVVQLRLSHAGNTIVIDQGPANVWRPVAVPTSNPDTLSIFVATAGAGGETADLTLAVETYTAGPRISLGFGSAAVLDSGITIYAGQLPLILPGPALDTDIFAVADAAGRLVNVIDLFYP